MVNKLLRALIVLIMIFIVVVFIPDNQSSKSPVGNKVILEMMMYPIEDSDGEFMLEYRKDANGPIISREILKKDGKRYPVGQIETHIGKK